METKTFFLKVKTDLLLVFKTCRTVNNDKSHKQEEGFHTTWPVSNSLYDIASSFSGLLAPSSAPGLGTDYVSVLDASNTARKRRVPP